jgi:hypothetical protein
LGDIINLRRVRKAKARKTTAEAAAENRARFGRPRAEREVAEQAQTLESRRLDGHFREPSAGERPENPPDQESR